MTLSKFTNQPANKEIVDTINDIIDAMGSTTGANIDLSNLSATGQAVIDGKVSKSGDTMTGTLEANVDDNNRIAYKIGNISTSAERDIQFYNTSANHRVGVIRAAMSSDGTMCGMTFGACNPNNDPAQGFSIQRTNSSVSCSFPNTTCVDGQWVISFAEILASGTSLNGSSNLPKRIPVPNDGYVYEVLLIGRATTGTTSGNLVRLQLYTNILTSNGALICSARTRANSSVECQGTATVLVKGVASSSTNCTIDRATSFNGEGVVNMIAYRRVGTNS